MNRKVGCADTHMAKVVRIIVASATVMLMFVSGGVSETVEPSLKNSIVKSGDRADVHFTCRLKNGKTAISTYQDLAQDSSIPKSEIFLKRDRNTPILLIAMKDQPKPEKPKMMGFESWLFYRMSPVLVGVEIGKKISVEISTERLSEQKKGEHSIKMARVRKREKEVRFTQEEYKVRTGKTPEVGQPYIIDPTVPGKVASVTEKEVVIRFSATPLAKVSTPLGEGTVKEYEDRYEIVIDAHPGSLVRNGGIVGRISDIDERYITIDYGHPFGGETLICDILVESVNPEKKPDVSIVPHEKGET